MTIIERLVLISVMLGAIFLPAAWSSRAQRIGGSVLLVLFAALTVLGVLYLAGCAAPTRADIFSPQGPVNFPVPQK